MTLGTLVFGLTYLWVLCLVGLFAIVVVWLLTLLAAWYWNIPTRGRSFIAVLDEVVFDRKF